MRFDNKGFTLVEVLAVIVILGVLMAIMIPSVGNIIQKNKSDSYDSLKKSLVAAAKVYISDNRYEITIDSDSCSSNNEVLVTSVLDESLEDGKLSIQKLVDAGNVKTEANGMISDPRDDHKTLNLSDSYVIVKYLCKEKGYSYSLEDSYLKWQ